MPVFFAVLGLIGAVVIAEMVRIGWHMVISRRMTNSIKKFERHDSSAAKRILFIGDSTGHGTGASHPRYSIVGRLGHNFPNAHIENYSVGGQNLSDAIQILETLNNAKSRMYDLIVIMIGGIDIVYCTPLSRARRLLHDAVVLSKKIGREVIIISPNNTGLAPLYRFFLSSLYQKRAKQFDSLYRDLAREESVRHVSLFREYPDSLSAHDLFSPDKTHPNDAGYDLWYNEMKRVIGTTLTHHDRNSTS
jgi:lysophospholipase L1-like esterase